MLAWQHTGANQGSNRGYMLTINIEKNENGRDNYAVYEDGLCYARYETLEEAETEKAQIERDNEIHEFIETKIDEIAEELGVKFELGYLEACDMIREAL